ncbi:hypothetical protein GCM10010307_14810 [Streptomyces vastus]|uniref:Uncharacterized protein n=1 Tax=Streptomyces vastus TaxID=285451 RepID=A0ABN3QHN2_9ACTN
MSPMSPMTWTKEPKALRPWAPSWDRGEPEQLGEDVPQFGRKLGPGADEYFSADADRLHVRMLRLLGEGTERAVGMSGVLEELHHHLVFGADRPARLPALLPHSRLLTGSEAVRPAWRPVPRP